VMLSDIPIIIMLAKIAPFLLPTALAGTYYYLRKHPLSIDTPQLNTLFRTAAQKVAVTLDRNQSMPFGCSKPC